MALKLEFINVVIPLKLIRERLGQDALDGLIAAAGSTAWHDEYLARFGCMNEIDLDVLLDEWEGRGFVLFEELAGKKRWQDLCVVFSGHG